MAFINTHSSDNHPFERAFQQQTAGLAISNPEQWQARVNAFSHFKTLPFPSNRLEDWKYTHLAAYPFEQFSAMLNPKQEILTTELPSFLMYPAPRFLFCFVNGVIHPVSRNTPDLSMPSLESPVFNVQATLSKDITSLEALNQAFYYNGASLIIPNDCILAHPIYIYHVTESIDAPFMTHPKNTIILGENSQAVVIEVYKTCGKSPAFSNAVTDIHLAKQSQLTHLFIQEGSYQSIQTTTVKVHQALQSQYKNHIIATGGAVNRTTFSVELAGSGSECQLNALEFARENQHIDLYLGIEHKAPHCESKLITRGVSQENAQISFTGKIVVEKSAPKTKAFLENKNLLLSPNASVNTRPQLEIHNDDVQCAHGATVGNLDPDAVFYLKSRGIETKKANQLLVNGFIYPSLQNIPAVAMPYLENITDER